MGQFIELKAADGFTFPAYVAQPAGKPKGAVVVVQEIFGVNSHIRSVADGYAAAGLPGGRAGDLPSGQARRGTRLHRRTT